MTCTSIILIELATNTLDRLQLQYRGCYKCYYKILFTCMEKLPAASTFPDSSARNLLDHGPNDTTSTRLTTFIAPRYGTDDTTVSYLHTRNSMALLNTSPSAPEES